MSKSNGGTPKILVKMCSKAICYIAELGGVLKSLRARFSRLMVCMTSMIKSPDALQLKEIGGNLHSPMYIFSGRKLAFLEQTCANAHFYKDLRGTSNGVSVPQIWTDTLLPIVQSQLHHASLFEWRVEPEERERYRRRALRRQKIEARKRGKE